MIDLNTINRWRITTQKVIEMYGSVGNHSHGCFVLPSPIDRQGLMVVAAAGDGWEHVSVSRKNRCPNWAEMEFIKRKFWRDDEVAMQLHVKPKNQINCHPYALHIWRPYDAEIPVPPQYMVGPQIIIPAPRGKQ